MTTNTNDPQTKAKKPPALSLAKILDQMEIAKEWLEDRRDQLQDKLDNGSERWLESEGAERTQEKLDAIEQAANELETVIDALGTAADEIHTAMEL